MARLGEMFETQITGEWGSECTENETGTKVLRTTNFTPEGRINYDNVVVRSINESKVEKKRLHCSDIILEKSGGTEKTPVGRVVFCDESIEESIYLCNNFTQAMRVNQTIAIPRYVFYFMWNLHCSGRTDLLQNKTTGIRNLQVKSYLNEECPLPPLEEQRKIAAVLDKVSDLIAKRRTQLDKLDELVKSRFVEMFGDQKSNPLGWPQTTIGDCCTLKSGTSLPADKENEGGAIPYVKVADMNYPGNEQYITTSSRFVTEQTAGAGIFPVGTVIFPKRGGAIATNKKRLTTLPICADLNVMGVTAGNVLKSQYLMTYFDMVDLGALDNGSSVPQINNKDIAPLMICLPPLGLQEQFAAFVAQTDKTKTAVQKSLEKLEILKKALMQKYFG